MPVVRVKVVYDAVTSPTVNEDADAGYGVFSVVMVPADETIWDCYDNTNDAAVWRERISAPERSKLTGIELLATADQSAAEIEAIVSHNALVDYVTNQHVNWVADDALVVHPNNYADADPTVKGAMTASHAIRNRGSTGLLTGGLISQNGATAFDISAGTGTVVNDYLDPLSPSGFFDVSWTAQIAVAIVDTTDGFKYIIINGTATIVQFITPFGPVDRRVGIVIGKIFMLGGAIVFVQPDTDTAHSVGKGLSDMARVAGYVNVGGNVFSVATGNTMQVQKTDGVVWGWGIAPDVEGNPHTVTLTATDPETFSYSYRDGAGGWKYQNTSDLIVPGDYDDGTGTLNSFTGNNWTVQYLWMFPYGEVIVQYGQRIFATLEDAINGAPNATHIPDDNAKEGALLMGWLAISRTATDLGDTAQAIFVHKFR